MVNVMVAELQAVAAKGAISDIELSRAKNVRHELGTHPSVLLTRFLLRCFRFRVCSDASIGKCSGLFEVLHTF